MAVTATTRLPAGWYPDPDGGNRRRWWDGREWTQYTAAFLRPTSVDELELDVVAPATGKPGRKPRRGKTAASAAVDAAKPDPVAKPIKLRKKSRSAESALKAAPEAADAPAERLSAAERLGRLLAGAAYAIPTIRRTRKHRRAHRLNK